MKYRILGNGDKYKVQNTMGIWPFISWVDIGTRKRTGIWELSLFDGIEAARDCIATHIKINDKGQWKIVAGGL